MSPSRRWSSSSHADATVELARGNVGLAHRRGVVTKRVFMVGVVAATVLVLLGWPGPGVTAQEALAPYRIGYTGQSSTSDRDIFSVNSAGADTRDATNRAGADETDPAYSPDGAKLAYVDSGEAGSRV